MTENRHTDERIGVLLALALNKEPPEGACPTLEEIAAWHDRRFSGRRREEMQAHMAHCDHCYAVWTDLTAAHELLQPETATQQGWLSRWLEGLVRGSGRLRPSLVGGGLAVSLTVLLVAALLPPRFQPDTPDTSVAQGGKMSTSADRSGKRPNELVRDRVDDQEAEDGLLASREAPGPVSRPPGEPSRAPEAARPKATFHVAAHTVMDQLEKDIGRGFREFTNSWAAGKILERWAWGLIADEMESKVVLRFRGARKPAPKAHQKPPRKKTETTRPITAFRAAVRTGLEQTVPDTQFWKIAAKGLPTAPKGCAGETNPADCEKENRIFQAAGRWAVLLHFACGAGDIQPTEAQDALPQAFWTDQAAVLARLAKEMTEIPTDPKFPPFLSQWAEKVRTSTGPQPGLCEREEALLALGLKD